MFFQKTSYGAGAGPVNGMRLARKLGMVTYRSAREWDQRFGREGVEGERQTGNAFARDFEVEAYRDAHAQKFTGQFDANCVPVPVPRRAISSTSRSTVAP